jgi:hypothetical protein
MAIAAGVLRKEPRGLSRAGYLNLLRKSKRDKLSFPDSSEAEHSGAGFQFPGRCVGGVSLILGPILLLTGVLLRIQFHFFFPQQLAAFHSHPTLITASYSCFLAGNILLWPAIVTLAQMIGAQKPYWALWGGTLVLFGLFARTFHAGVDQLAFQLVRVHSAEVAARTVASSYGAFHVISTLNPVILFGWMVLAIGAYLSGVLGLSRSVALGSMAALMIGVLKGTTWVSVAATGGLCIALVPLGIQVLREAPTPSGRTVLGWGLTMLLLLAALYFLGQAG